MNDANGFAISSDFMVKVEMGSPDTPSGRTIESDEGIGGVGIRDAKQAANLMRLESRV